MASHHSVFHWVKKKKKIADNVCEGKEKKKKELWKANTKEQSSHSLSPTRQEYREENLLEHVYCVGEEISRQEVRWVVPGHDDKPLPQTCLLAGFLGNASIQVEIISYPKLLFFLFLFIYVHAPNISDNPKNV